MEISLPNKFKYDSVKGLIYHYTTLSGAINILKNGCLWASCSNYLNDYSEISVTIDGFIQYLKNLCETTNKKDEKIFIDRILEYYNSPSRINKNQVYIISFSEDKDLLSQWRAYSEDGYGVSIGFDINQLDLSYAKDIEDFKNVKPYLLPVEYNDSELKKFFLRLYKYTIAGPRIEDTNYYSIDKVLEKIVKFDHRTEMNLKTFKILERMSACFKNDGFKEEKEWRIVKFDQTYKKLNEGFGEDFNVRISGKQLIPYYEIPINRNSIKEIIIGPKNNYENMQYSMTLLKKKYDYSFEINKSLITYR